MSDRSVQADVVKKAVLKYKASKLRGTTGSSVQGPKAYKDFYVVFRAISGERKELEIFNNERRFHEGSPPKLLVDLNDAVAIHVMNGKRSEFYVELNDGGMCLFEAKNPEDSLDWVSCLNAVLFAKGPNGEAVLQYNVELQESEILTSQGPAILELKDGELIISRKDNNAEIVKWRLSHIRSFKAKKRLLTIFSGSRSSTGVGEFLFKSERSVEITHAIETVVGAMAKDKKSSKTHLSRPPIQNGQGRIWSSSVVDSIPDFQPPVVYEDIPETDASTFDTAGYGKLNFKDRSPPTLTSPEHEGGGPGRRGIVGGARHTSPTPRPTLHHAPSASGTGATRTTVPLPGRRTGRRDYEDLDLDEGGVDDEEQKHGGNVNVVPPHETYSRLEREKSPARRMSPPDKPVPYNKKSSGAAGRHGPLPSRPHVPPPSPKPSDVPTDVPDGLYAAINKPKKPRAAATVHSSRPVPPSSARIAKPSLNMHSGSNPDLSNIHVGHEEYGKLDRRLPTSAVPLPQEEYNTLDLVASKVNGGSSVLTPPALVGGQEEYGKLEHVANKRYSHGPHIAEQYGKLEVGANLKSSSTAIIPPSSHYEMQQNDDEPIPPPLPSTSSAAAAASIIPPGDQEEYGKLHQFGGPPPPSSSSSSGGGVGGRGPAVGSSRLQPHHHAPTPAAAQEEYGRLERPMGKGTSSVPSTPEDEYGHLETRPRTSSFNPYGTLSSEEFKATNQTTSGGVTTNSNVNVRKHTRSGSSGGAIGSGHNSQLAAPPPGYENTEVKQPSPAYRASIVGSQVLGGRPQAPPRGASNGSPPLQKKNVHGYVNVDEKGQVRKPLPPTKPHLESGAPSSRAPLKSAASADSSTPITSSSLDPPLKSHDMNGAAFPARRKPIVSSSDYEDTETLEFGMKPPILQKQKSTSDAVLPPPAPRRGPSIRNAVSATNVAPAENSTNLKPSVAPKPKPKLKAKPVN